MKRLKFIWIDDKTEKIKAFRAPIESGAAAVIETLRVEKGFLEVLEKWVGENKSEPPDLFIIDHVYNLNLPFGLNGSSVAHLLRNAFPSVPIVCVTAKLDDQDAFDQDDLSEYTAIFPYTRLERYVEHLAVIARDFKKLMPASKVDIRRHLVSCLKAPERDQKDLLRILPEEFKNERHATTGHRIGRWIYNVLRRRPGFLYDRLFAATLLGLNQEGFNRVERLFVKALYTGVFAIPSEPRWWASELRRILFSLTPADGPDIPQYAGRLLTGIRKSDYSTCYLSKKSEPPPDAVAFADGTREAERRVVRREFTKQHPFDLGLMAGFETQLMLRRPRGH